MNVSWSLAGALSAVFLFTLVTAFSARTLIQILWKKTIRIIESDPSPKNVWELVSLAFRIDPEKMVENNMRAAGGVLVKRPFGSPKRLPDFEGFTFLPRQMAELPLPQDAEVDTQTTIGPHARHPLKLDIPLLVSGMALGMAVSQRLKIALARGATQAGTATSTGEGPFLPEERKEAEKLIIQYSRAPWAKDPEILQQADMVEIHIGQGSSGPGPSQVPSFHLKGRAMQLMDLAPGGTAEIKSRMPGIHRKKDWRKLVNELRQLTDGVPIGMKLLPGRVEQDLEIALHAEVDFITLDGAQAGTKGTAPILQDDLGLPTVIGLCRAVDFLEKKGVKDQVSVIVSGGLKTPGDFLKALALGADAVALGSALVFAASHGQGSQKPLPWEPPTELVWYDGNLSHQLDIDKAARHTSLFFQSCTDEMKLAAQALGKKSLRDVNKKDLLAMDSLSSSIADVPLI